jgi:ligand-binding SRPBCC domain-containing protein
LNEGKTIAMREFTLTRSQTLDRSLDEVFSFFADARNLARITPDWLKFTVVTSGPIEMAQGTLIDYRIKLRGIPMRWQSEITVWEPPHRFVDEQRRGPYKFWVHEHTFEAIDADHTRVGDRVRYGVPGGGLVHRLFVERDLDRIFEYREQKLVEKFGGNAHFE